MVTPVNRLGTGRSAEFSENGGGGGGGGGSSTGIWQVIEKKTVLADTDTVDFLSLDGEFDGFYFLEYTIRKGVGGLVRADLQPNGAAGNRTESLTWGTSVAPVQGSTAGYMSIYGSGGGIGEAQRGTVTFWPKTGLARSGLVETLEASIAFNSAYRVVSTITWLESVTAITSLRVKANVAGGIQAGSVLTLYKVTPTGSSEIVKDIFYRDYFSQANLLPSNIVQDAMYTFPAEDFTFNGGPGAAPTLTRQLSRMKILGNANAAFNFGWDMGAARDKVLIVMGGLRLRNNLATGLFIGPTPNQTGIVVFTNQPYLGSGFHLAGAGGVSNLSDYVESGATSNREIGMALYYDRTVPKIQAFVKTSGQWFLTNEYAVDEGQMRYAGVYIVPDAAGEIVNAVCPLVIRYD